MIDLQSRLNPGTPEGIYGIKLALTGNEEIARQAETEAVRALLEARLSSCPPDLS